MAQIDHVVVLMLENRSFDSLLGRLYPASPEFDGLTGDESNIVNGQTIPVWTSGAATWAAPSRRRIRPNCSPT